MACSRTDCMGGRLVRHAVVTGDTGAASALPGSSEPPDQGERAGNRSAIFLRHAGGEDNGASTVLAKPGRAAHSSGTVTTWRT